MSNHVSQIDIGMLLLLLLLLLLAAASGR